MSGLHREKCTKTSSGSVMQFLADSKDLSWLAVIHLGQTQVLRQDLWRTHEVTFGGISGTRWLAQRFGLVFVADLCLSERDTAENFPCVPVSPGPS